MNHDEMQPQDAAHGQDQIQDEGVERQPLTELAPQAHIPFEELTLAQVTGEFVRSPGETLRKVMRLAQQSPYDDDEYEIAFGGDALHQKEGVTQIDEEPPSGFSIGLGIPNIEIDPKVRVYESIQLILRITAFLAALWGGVIIATAGRQGLEENLYAATPFWLGGFFLWLASEFISLAPALVHDRKATLRPISTDIDYEADHLPPVELLFRVILGGICVLLCVLTLRWTANNHVTLQGFVTWIVSMIVAVWVFAPRYWNPTAAIIDGVRGLGNLSFRLNWTVIAFFIILLMGGIFRFTDIAGTPPEMTSDHVEKILDSWRVLQGDTQVFFFRNGGREPIQMYLMALLAQFPGFGVDFFTLKTLTAIEGFLTLPIMFWLGRTIIGREDRKLGNLAGLTVMALVAASQWHQTLSHLGLRIVLTSLVAAVVLIYLAKGLRTNQRMPFVVAGLALGIGLYTYQAVRMLPVVVIVGFVIALFYHLRDMQSVKRLMVNGVALVAVSLVAFAPMLGYIQESPAAFFQRTSTRILGDYVITEVGADGSVTERPANTFEALWNQREAIANNIVISALAYNFKGDITWLQNASLYPFMDAVTGALLIVGLAAWIGLMIRRRDPIFDLWLPMGVILLLPSALALAFPIENPSATRLSASLPIVYVIAGLALAVLLQQVVRGISGRLGYLVAGFAMFTIIGTAFNANWKTYFGDYARIYSLNVYAAYSDPGSVLRTFANSESGSYGNAFMVVYPYWWDHRAVGIEAGAPDWQGDIIDRSTGNNRELIPQTLFDAWLRDGDARFNPDLDILFFFEPSDELTETYLQSLFPSGYSQLRETYLPNKSYKIFRVPALSAAGWIEFIDEHRLN